MRSASRFLRKKKAPTLMLTSLLDMFTIILIFLIVSFDTENQDFRLDENVTLPESSARAEFRPAVNLAVSGDAITVGDDTVATLAGGRASDAQVREGRIASLVAALEAEYRRRYGDDAGDGDAGAVGEEEDDEPIVVIQADRELDYRTLYVVLRSAASAGFYKYRLAVLKS